MTIPSNESPHDFIKRMLQCDAEKAERVRQRLALVCDDRDARAFLRRACCVDRTTREIGADRDDMLVSEGTRTVALFFLNCWGRQLDTNEPRIPDLESPK